MTRPPQRRYYRNGETVLVEGVVEKYDPTHPFGEVHVMFKTATDPSHLLDGVEVVLPQVAVHTLTPHADKLYDLDEGFYPPEDDE